jgi:hypothetical protein
VIQWLIIPPHFVLEGNRTVLIAGALGGKDHGIAEGWGVQGNMTIIVISYAYRFKGRFAAGLYPVINIPPTGPVFTQACKLKGFMELFWPPPLGPTRNSPFPLIIINML